jgi:hypothetical protein
MRITSIIVFILFAVVFGLVGVSQAMLIDMHDGTIYDPDMQISWLKDPLSVMIQEGIQTGIWNGLGEHTMPWSVALEMADALNFAGFDDWRLPTAYNQDGSGPCLGYDCVNSEMGHLFYTDLGGIAGDSILNSNNPDVGLFSGIIVSQYPDESNLFPSYWSSTKCHNYDPSYPDTCGWQFDFNNGSQGNPETDSGLLWAVRDGIRSVQVSEPGTWLFLGSGMASLVTLRRKFM